MIDSNSQFFAILTAVGEAKQANATALGIPWTFKDMAVGDANGTDPVPDRAQTRLINEWRRAPVNQVRTDPANPNLIITEQVIPSDVGGRWIREIGLYDAAGDLVAVANCAPSFKPLLAQGTGKTQIIRMNFIVSNTAQIVLKIDPAVVLATRQYVDDSLATALPGNKTAGTYRQVTIDKRGIVLSGVNPTTLAGYGITDAFTKPETTAAIQQAVAALVASAPGALDTLKELADAMGNDPNFATTVTNALSNKANKATTLGGYGITDGATKAELNTAVGNLFPKTGGVMAGTIALDNGTLDTPEIAWRSPALDFRADVVDKVFRCFAVLAGETSFPLTLDVANKVVAFFGNGAWHTGNFNPASKADKAATLGGYGIGDAYTRSQVDNLFNSLQRGIGDGQYWRDVTASRVSGTIYTNTTGRSIAVVISFTTGSVTAYVDGVRLTNSAYHASFIVPAGAVYTATINSGAVNPCWVELRT
ncbi:phage tail protein [Pseudomonas sp. MSSRFD41]|nr:phage tail protein [Pseudomonas sp. MSSRFD41]MBC2658491.1 phage tail protein [Pseudomonas sp. MSSRFD41]